MIWNQIIANIMLTFILLILIFFAVITGDITLIVASIVFGVLVILFILQAIKVIKLDKGKKVKHNTNYTLYIVLIIVGVFFTILLSLLIKNITYRVNGVEATATVYKVDQTIDYRTEYDENGNSYQNKEEHCDVYIRYKVQNKEYETKLDFPSCKYKKEDKIKIYYSKGNPEKVVSSAISNLIILIIGVMFSGAVFLYIIIKSLKKK